MDRRDHTGSNPTAVLCRGVVKELGVDPVRSRVLCGIDLDLPAGEMTLLVGPSGCGKTTLISVIAGVLLPNSGDVDVFGTRVSKLRGTAAARFRAANIGFIMQQFNLFPALTAVENVTLPLLAQGVSGRKAVARAIDLLRELDLEQHLAKFPAELSMGQQQRVAIARALIHEPRLVVCDEPTAALDAMSGLAVMQLLRRVALKPNRAVIVVTHDHRILPFADRIARMSDGRIIGVELPVSKEAA
jgi:putative ABC transport system ATP-binding protein